MEEEMGSEEEIILNNQFEKVVPFVIFLLATFLFFKIIEPMITIFLSSILIKGTATISTYMYAKEL